MIIAWRAYKFVKHVDDTGQATDDPDGYVKRPECVSSFHYKKLLIRKLSEREKQLTFRYALKHGYIDNPYPDAKHVPIIKVNDDLGIRLLTDKFLGVPYAALHEAFKPYVSISIGAALGAVAIYIWHVTRTHVHMHEVLHFISVKLREI